MQALRQSSNPQAMVSNLMQSNPQFRQAANLVNDIYKGDGRAAFYAEARAKGMSDQQIEEFIRALQ